MKTAALLIAVSLIALPAGAAYGAQLKVKQPSKNHTGPSASRNRKIIQPPAPMQSGISRPQGSIQVPQANSPKVAVSQSAALRGTVRHHSPNAAIINGAVNSNGRNTAVINGTNENWRHK